MYSNFLAEQMEGIDEDDRVEEKVKKAQERCLSPPPQTAKSPRRRSCSR